MKDKKKIEEAVIVLKDLEKTLEDVIVDLHGIKGTQQARHAFCFYRNLVWETINILQKDGE